MPDKKRAPVSPETIVEKRPEPAVTLPPAPSAGPAASPSAPFGAPAADLPGARPPSETVPTLQVVQPSYLPARAGASPAAAADAGAAAEPAGQPFGRYRLLEELGRGGMGVVFRAWDTELKRVVALKTLLPAAASGTEDVERFQREARAAARLRHPNVVQVHDVGSCDGRHFFTMDYVDGESLNAAAKRLAPRRFLEVLRDVALALHAAHESGIVHRDVKPANVLLDRTDRPYVSDFGLAKEVKEGARRGVTVTGAVLGTPQYMSPEQAGGIAAEIGPWSDQWSLGVMLYEHLAGCRPFEEPTFIGLIWAIDNKEPVPPSRAAAAAGRARRVHKDLETICLKALEKDRRRRYASAAEFAADLGRFLEGEPIAARPPSMVYRVQRWAGRRRGLVAGAILLAAVASTAGVWVWRAEARARRSLAQGELVNEVRAPLAEALGARRGGDVELLRQVAADAAARADRLLATDPGLAEAHFLKGWLFRLTGRRIEARKELDLAIEARPEDVAARYQRGLLLASLYRDALADARRAWRRRELAATVSGGDAPGSLTAAREPATAELDAFRPELPALRAAVARDCAVLEHAQAAARDWGPREQAWFLTGRALLAAFSDDSAAAAALLDSALERDRYLDDARLARIDLLRARPLDPAGLEQVIEAYGEALKFNRGLEELWRGRAEMRDIGAEAAAAGGRPDAAFAAWRDAAADAEQARTLAPEAWEPTALACQILGNWGNNLAGRSPEAQPLHERAVALAADLVARFPDSSRALSVRGRACADVARAAAGRGVDPSDLLARALADLDRVVALDPLDASAFLQRGLARRSQALADMARGADPRPSLNRAIADFSATLRLEPAHASALNNRGDAYTELGLAEAGRRLDPLGSYQKALEDFRAANRANGALHVAVYNAARVQLLGAQARRARGVEYQGLIKEALANLQSVLRADPHSIGGLLNRSALYRDAGRAEAASGRDARDLYRRGLADLDAAARTAPENATVFFNRGRLRRDLAEALTAAGEDPAEVLDAASADYDEGLQLNPSSVDALLARGLARRDAAKNDAGHGRDGRPAVARAIADCDEALQRAPGSCVALEARGRAWLLMAELQADRVAEARAAGLKALADFETSARQSADAPAALLGRAEARIRLALADETEGRPPDEVYAQALADVEAALRANPEEAGGYELRARVRLHRARHEAGGGRDAVGLCRDAIADCEEALRRDPGCVDARSHRSTARLLLADAEVAAGRDPQPLYEAAIADADETLRLRPAYALAYNVRAQANSHFAHFEETKGRDPRPRLRAAIRDYDEAVKRGAGDGSTWNNRAYDRFRLGEAESARGGDPTPEYELGLKDCDEGIRRHAPVAILTKGEILRALGRLEEAIAAFEEGGKRDAHWAAWARAEIERTRAMVRARQK